MCFFVSRPSKPPVAVPLPLSLKEGEGEDRDCHWEGVMADRKRETSDLCEKKQGVLTSFFISLPKIKPAFFSVFPSDFAAPE